MLQARGVHPPRAIRAGRARLYIVAIKMDGTAEDLADLDEIKKIIMDVYGE
jgi:hypothetical protein